MQIKLFNEFKKALEYAFEQKKKDNVSSINIMEYGKKGRSKDGKTEVKVKTKSDSSSLT